MLRDIGRGSFGIVIRGEQLETCRAEVASGAALETATAVLDRPPACEFREDVRQIVWAVRYWPPETMAALEAQGVGDRESDDLVIELEEGSRWLLRERVGAVVRLYVVWSDD